MKLNTVHPLALKNLLWPDVRFYKEQVEIIESVFYESDETFCAAGNMLGKDFIAGFIAVAFFLTREPCRIVTTSVDHSQLEGVLWGEIRRFIQSSKYPLDSQNGGPLVVNHLHIRKVDPTTKVMCPLSYLIGRVASKGEGMLGHHIAKTGDRVPRTLFMGDEASGLDDINILRARTWADRTLLIGNCFPCNNEFRRGIRAGNLESKTY